MTVTTATFKVRFPEFVSQDDSRIQLFLDDAETMLNFTYWGTKYDLGVNYYTAHELAKSIAYISSGGSGGGSGVISGKSVDGVSVSYATSTPSNTKEAYYMSTPYGIKYWSLLRSLPIAAASI